MINWTPIYIISQILIVAVYICLCITYFLKNRNHILIVNILAHIMQATSFLLLGGLTGVAMNFVYTIRDLFFVVDEKRNKKKNTKRDIMILLFFIIIIVLLTIFTYDGLSSLLSVFATIISTIAIWQKSTKIYKILGIPISIAWLGYHISLMSIFAIILESILLISIIVGYIFEVIKTKKSTLINN